jgi:hypothetical protein
MANAARLKIAPAAREKKKELIKLYFNIRNSLAVCRGTANAVSFLSYGLKGNII